MRRGGVQLRRSQEREFMEDFDIGDRVKVIRTDVPGFTSYVGSEGTIQELDPTDPDGFTNTVQLTNGPVLYFSNEELEKLNGK
jgi:hypothetical protein